MLKNNASLLRNNKLIFSLIGVLSTVVFVLLLSLLRNVYETETYYVLSQPVSSRTEIQPAMLQPIETSSGTAPNSALTIADIQSNKVFAKYDLNAGDILTVSNVGKTQDVTSGIPDTWVITTFDISANNAAGGQIKKGTYFDFLVAQKNGARYPFVNVLALDVTSNTVAADQKDSKTSGDMQITVGLPPGDAAMLHQILEADGERVHLLVSPKQNDYQKPQLASYTGAFKFDGESPKNAGDGADSSFTPVERDASGKPLKEKTANCSEGNVKLSDEQCSSSSK